MTKRKIALFGGTFDPIHIGHTSVAKDASEQIGTEKIIFIPAKRSPLKGFLPKANDKHRFEMISLAITDEKDFGVSDYELTKPAPSYTLETVQQYKNEYGSDTSIHWLIGADTIEDLTYWHKIVELIDTCFLTTMYRAGCAEPDFSKFESQWGTQRIEKLQQNIIQTPLVDISSTEIRERLATGRDVNDMLAPSVIEYIHKHDLYKPKLTEEGK
jgi:nicotinate-nucleotide adenylyltransferase